MKTKCILKHVKNDIWWKLDNLIDASKGIALDCVLLLIFAIVCCAILMGAWYTALYIIPRELFNMLCLLSIVGFFVLFVLYYAYIWILKPIYKYFKRVYDHCNAEHGN